MRRVIVSFAIVLMTAGSAGAVTLKDIVDLTKAGLGDEVLLALIEVDGGVFSVDSTTLTALKAAGVSDKVIVALVRSGRERPLPEAQPLADVVAQQQAPEVTYLEPPPPTTIVREVSVPVPVYVAVPVFSGGRHRHSGSGSSEVLQPSITAPLAISGPPRYRTDVPPPPKNQEPVYWGSGGKLRPDAWKPSKQ